MSNASYSKPYLYKRDCSQSTQKLRLSYMILIPFWFSNKYILFDSFCFIFQVVMQKMCVLPKDKPCTLNWPVKWDHVMIMEIIRNED